MWHLPLAYGSPQVIRTGLSDGKLDMGATWDFFIKYVSVGDDNVESDSVWKIWRNLDVIDTAGMPCAWLTIKLMNLSNLYQ